MLSPMNLRSLFVATMTALVLSACAYHVDKQNGDAQADQPTAEMIGRVSYGNVSAIFQNRCVACHGNSGGVSLESLAGARAALGRIYQSAVVARSMPKAPYPPLSRDERRTLWAWIEAGGPDQPNNGGTVTPPPPPPSPLEPNFASIQSHILNKKCVTCHSPGGKAERVPLLTRSDLVDSADDVVVPGDISQSVIVHVLSPGARKPMPPPDSGISPVSPQELEVIKTWITNGAKD